MATRYDVARISDVSAATVSHVINNTKYVSPELKERVLKAINELDYKPNIVARSLVTKSTKHVGILINDITNPYYGEIAQGMEEIAQQNGYMVSLCLASGNADSYISSIMQRQMDGLFIATVYNKFSREQIQQLSNMNVKIVNDQYSIGSCICFNYSDAIDNLVKYFADMGHKRIGFLSGLDTKSDVDARYKSYMKAVQKYGLDSDENLVVEGIFPYNTDFYSGYEAMKKLLSRVTRVTAVMTTNDYMAFGAMKAIKEAGLRIPEDISIAGCDDIFLSECTDPSLTTIRVPKKEMGRQAMYAILNEINRKATVNIELAADLVIRKSTSSPAERG